MLLGNAQAQFKGNYLEEVTIYGEFWSKLASCHPCQSSNTLTAGFVPSAVPAGLVPYPGHPAHAYPHFHAVKNLSVMRYRTVFILP